MTGKPFSKEVRTMKRMVIIMILALGMVVIGCMLYSGKAQAGEGAARGKDPHHYASTSW